MGGSSRVLWWTNFCTAWILKLSDWLRLALRVPRVALVHWKHHWYCMDFNQAFFYPLQVHRPRCTHSQAQGQTGRVPYCRGWETKETQESIVGDSCGACNCNVVVCQIPSPVKRGQTTVMSLLATSHFRLTHISHPPTVLQSVSLPSASHPAPVGIHGICKVKDCRLHCLAYPTFLISILWSLKKKNSVNVLGHSHDQYVTFLNFWPTFPSKDKEKDEPSPVSMRPSRKGQDGLRAVGQNKVQCNSAFEGR